MLKPYEVTVTYRLYALDETDATGQVLTRPAEPDAVDVVALPNSPSPDVTIPDF